ncbi:MAG TPA: hypothetical protein PK514_00105 [Spirochaetota bacterium]|nr:hypothetical protein [Spirochaetota bacterium]
MKLIIKKLLLLFLAVPVFFSSTVNTGYADTYKPDYTAEYNYSSVSLNTVNGKFYAYIVLLFNENQHFVNLIQKGTISLKEMGNYGFNVKAYKNYLATIQDSKLFEEAELLLKVYLEPQLFSDVELKEIEKHLLKRNVVLKFYTDKTANNVPLSLDYIIYGEKIRIDIRHPLLDLQEEMFYIKPYIYYDEFSTSNTTLYYDLIYISPDEVNNDYIIAKGVLSGKEIKSRFFVGSRVTEDIRFCLLRSFRDSSTIKAEIWRMFVIHELTHKYLDKKFRSFDQITGEEISLSSTIYSNQYLGLSVLYSYLNYGQMNPHRIAAVNYISYIAQASGNRELVSNPGQIKNLPMDKLKDWTKSHFYNCLNRLEQ